MKYAAQLNIIRVLKKEQAVRFPWVLVIICCIGNDCFNMEKGVRREFVRKLSMYAV